MANKSPKHDFAPSWLKIPDEGGLHGKLRDSLDGPPGRHRREDYFGGPPRFAGPQDFFKNPLQRHGSYDNYERRFPGPKVRHHSLEDDYYNCGYMPPMPPPPPPHPFFNSYGSNYDGFNGPGLRGQPPIYRDAKYMHPNARFTSPNMNNKFSPYDPYYDQYHSDYYPPGPGRGRGNGRTMGKDNRHLWPDKYSRKHKDEDFPSLNGDSPGNDGKNRKKSLLSGAWEKPPNKSNTTNHSPKNIFNESQNGGVPASGGRIYKAVVSSKAKKLSSKEALTEKFLKVKEHSTKTVNNNNNQASHTVINGVNGIQDESEENVDDNEVNSRVSSQAQLIKGMSSLSVSQDEKILSSSLEAEQRLLREMGWEEEGDDEDPYEITEEDMKAFLVIKKLKEQKTNGVCMPACNTNGNVTYSAELTNDLSNSSMNSFAEKT